MSAPIFHFDLKQYLFDPNDPYNYQANEEWLALRADRITASVAGDLFVNGKSASGLGANIIDKLERRVMQRYSGWIDDDSLSFQEKEAVRRGIIYEREAMEWYSRKTGRRLMNCGFVQRGQFLGCSPDSVVEGERRLVQCKIPMPQNFIREVMAQGKDHLAQCKTELYVSDFEVNDLLIYSPELKLGWIREITRDPIHDRTLLSKVRVAVKHQRNCIDVVEKLMNHNGGYDGSSYNA